MRKLLILVSLVCTLLFASVNLRATTLLVDQVNPYLAYGYGLSSWNTFTGDLNSAFGASNITVSSSPLDNLAYLMSFDRLLLTAGSPGDSLTPTEIANIQAFIATGRRVLLTGENGGWTAWNNSILATVGGTYSGTDTSDTLTPVLVSQLTAGVPNLVTIIDGIASGGTPLFNENVATLWGGSQNVLTLLSLNVEDDTRAGNPGNAQFDSNMAVWLAGTAVPEPCTLILVGTGIAAVLSRRRLHSS